MPMSTVMAMMTRIAHHLFQQLLKQKDLTKSGIKEIDGIALLANASNAIPKLQFFFSNDLRCAPASCVINHTSYSISSYLAREKRVGLRLASK